MSNSETVRISPSLRRDHQVGVFHPTQIGWVIRMGVCHRSLEGDGILSLDGRRDTRRSRAVEHAIGGIALRTFDDRSVYPTPGCKVPDRLAFPDDSRFMNHKMLDSKCNT
jgi:hypothetical protein